MGKSPGTLARLRYFGYYFHEESILLKMKTLRKTIKFGLWAAFVVLFAACFWGCDMNTGGGEVGSGGTDNDDGGDGGDTGGDEFGYPIPSPDLDPVPEGKTGWKVLWAIARDHVCEDRDTSWPEDEVPVPYSISEQSIGFLKEKAVWFEEFVEAHTNGKLDIQVTVVVLAYPIKSIADKNHNYNITTMDPRDAARLEPEKNFDSCIFSADYSGVSRNWVGLNWGFYSMVGYGSGWFYVKRGGEWHIDPGATNIGYYGNKQLHTNIYVHEWIHQLERVFSARGMPVLHNDSKYPAYNATSTFKGQTRLEKWYADILQGTVDTTGGESTNTGVHPEWWAEWRQAVSCLQGIAPSSFC
jgi:hypothetical protein